MKTKSASRLVRSGSRAACLLAVSITAGLAAGPAGAEVINGISFLQPVGVTVVGSPSSPALDDTSSSDPAVMIDGSGINPANGQASIAAADGYSAYCNGDMGIVFDLGAYYTLSSMHVWNGNNGEVDFAEKAGPTRNVWVSTAVAADTNDSDDGHWEFDTPADTFGMQTFDNNQPAPLHASPIYRGVEYPLATSGAVRYVMFAYRDGNSSWVTDSSDTNQMSLQEVRFQVAAPPPIVWSATTDDEWDNSDNWAPSGVPGADDTALFNGTDSQSAVTLAAAQSLRNLTFDTALAPAYTLGTPSGPPLTLSSGGVLQTTSSVHTAQTVNAPLVVAGWNTFASAAGDPAATLALGGAVTGAATGSLILTLAGSNTGSISGDIRDGPSNPLALSNNGSWALSGTNTYSGGTTVAGGTLALLKTASLPDQNAPGKIAVSGNGTLLLSAGGTGEFSASDLTRVMENGTFAGGTLAIDTSNAAADLTVTPATRVLSSFTKLGDGTLTFTSGFPRQGAISVGGGTLELAGNSRIGAGDGNSYWPMSIATTATFIYNTDQDGSLQLGLSGAGDLVKDNTSTLGVRWGLAGGFSGSVFVRDGTIQCYDNQPGQDVTDHHLTLDGGALTWDWPDAYFANPLTLGPGGGTLDNATAGGGTFATGDTAFSGSGDRTLTLKGTRSGSVFNQNLGDPSVGYTSVNVASGGWTLGGTNTYSGTTSVSGSGSLTILKQPGSLGGFVPSDGTSGVSVDAGLVLAVGVGNEGDGCFDAAALGTILDASHLGASTATTGLKTGALFGMDTSAAAAGTFTYSNVLADLGADHPLNFAKTGSGTLILDHSNTYTGATTVMGPTNQQYSILQAGNAEAFGPATSAKLTFGPVLGQQRCWVDLHGIDMTVVGLTAPTGNDGGPYAFGNYVGNGADGTTATLTINNTDDCFYGGALLDGPGSGKLAIVKDGPGTLSVFTWNVYDNWSGGLAIRQGTFSVSSIGDDYYPWYAGNAVVMGDVGSTGTLRHEGDTDTCSKTFTLADGGTGAFDVANSAATMTLSGPLGGGGALTKTGPGHLALAGTTDYSGATTVSEGTLELVNVNPNNHTAAVAIADAATLQLDFAGSDVVGSLTIAGIPMGPGTYGSNDSAAANKDSSHFAGPGMLDVGGVAPSYATWAAANGIDGQPAAGDFDNDGLANAVEMVLGGLPATRMDAALLPTLALVTDPPGVPDGNYLEFTYRRSALSVSAGLTAACQYTSDLASAWTTAVNNVGGVTVLDTPDFYGAGIDRVNVYVPRGANTMMFGRLQVTVP